MKSSISLRLLLTAGLATGGALFAMTAANAAESEKVTICHATGSEKNPFVVITVSATAGDLDGEFFDFDKNGHLDQTGNPLSGHEEDFFVEGDIPKSECSQPSPTPTPTPSPSPSPTATGV
jgi:hypothetical protein